MSKLRRRLAVTVSVALLALVGAASAPATPSTFPALGYATAGPFALWDPPASAPFVVEGFAGRAGATRISDDADGAVLSPRGDAVAYLVPHGRKTLPNLWLATWTGSAVGRRAVSRQVDSTGAFSPDGARFAFVTRGGTKRRSFLLRVLTLPAGTVRTVVASRSFFLGFSFSPDGRQLAFVPEESTATDEGARGDVQVVGVTAGVPRRVTRDRRAKWPLWGQRGIVYLHARDSRKRQTSSSLDLVQGDGSGHRVVVRHAHTTALNDGFYPVALSADGTRLVVNDGGYDGNVDVNRTDAWAIDLTTGEAHDVTGVPDGVAAAGISADGTTVLAETGNDATQPGLDGGDRARHDIVTVPFVGGLPTLLVRGAFGASWSR